MQVRYSAETSRCTALFQHVLLRLSALGRDLHKVKSLHAAVEADCAGGTPTLLKTLTLPLQVGEMRRTHVVFIFIVTEKKEKGGLLRLFGEKRVTLWRIIEWGRRKNSKRNEEI